MSRPVRSVHDIKGVNLDVLEPILLHATGPLRIMYLSGRSSRLVISLSGVGRTRRGPPDIEFIGSSSCDGENHVLFVSDMSRSWMNGPGVAERVVRLMQQFVEFHDIDETVAMGNSMGGFAAFVLADLMPIDTVISFSPQFSAHPDIVPEEKRWIYHRQRIETWPYATVGEIAQPETRYFIFHGDTPEEAIHWRRFPEPQGINHFIFRGQDHNLVRVVQKRRLLQQVVSAAIDGRSRAVRKLLQREKLGHKFDVLRRADYEATYPAAQDAAPGNIGEGPTA